MASLMPQKLNRPAKIKMEITEDDEGPPVLDRVTPSPTDQSMLEPPPTLHPEVPQPGTSSFAMPNMSLYASNPGPSSSATSSISSTPDAFSERQTQMFFESINKSLQTQSSRIAPMQANRMAPIMPSSPLYSSFSMLQKVQPQARPMTTFQPLPHYYRNQITASALKPVIGKQMPKPLAAKPKPPIPMPILLQKPAIPIGKAVTPTNPSISISIKETRNSILENFLAASLNKPQQPRKVPSALIRALKKEPTVVVDDDDELPPPLIAATDMEPPAKRIKIDEDRPPSLEKATVPSYCNANYDDEAPPLLEREVPALNMGVKEEVCNLEAPVLVASEAPVLTASEAPVAAATSGAKGRKPVKKVPKITIKRVKSPDSDAPPTLEMYTTQEAGPSSMGSSSGVSSCAEEECTSPQTSAPLAPVNTDNKVPSTNRRSGRLQKENAAPAPSTRATPKRAASKRKASTAPDDMPAKKPRGRAKRQYIVPVSKPQAKCVLLESNWIPVGKAYADFIGHPRDHYVACCYPEIRHVAENVTLRIGDAILVNAEGDDGENVAYITKIYYDPDTGMRVEIFWYYRKHQCSTLVANASEAKFLADYQAGDRELIYYGEHSDNISCDTIQSPAHVLTFSEYNRYMAETKYDFLPEILQAQVSEFCSRGEDDYPRRKFLPHDDTPIDLVYFSRKCYKSGGRTNPLRDMGPCSALGRKRQLRPRRQRVHHDF
uniref:BAH domain-containing protein n=1 Tax=Panagrellus redivivus TaxID=6233 RepID=A0A7E4VIX9_PANRE